MSARVGLGLLISALVALASWLAVGAVSAAPPRSSSTASVWGDGAAPVAALVPAPVVGEGAATTDAANGQSPGGTGTGTGASTGAGSDSGPAPATSSPASGSGASGTAPTAAPPGRSWTAAATVSADWAVTAAATTGIPVRALIGYAGAALALQTEQPSCGLGWNTLAALGAVESGHGTHGGSAIGADGTTSPAIIGPALDGGEYDAIADSDGGVFDGDTTHDRAVGPLQFIPQTWQRWGADGNGDGRADPQQIDDAALAAARYLCHGGSVTDAAGWRAAVFSYNHVESYVDLVANTANEYTARAAAGMASNG